MGSSYDASLATIQAELPLVHQALLLTHTNRQRRLDQYAGGARLKGANELLAHLRAIESSLASCGHADTLGFIVGRAIADFEIALESALGGLLCLAHDSMRDVMEIEFLLRDFTAVPNHLDRWLQGSQDDLRTFFSPNRVRQREASRLGIGVNSLSGHADYRGHSMALHVTPWRTPITQKGVVKEDAFVFGPDMAFWEIFLHARRFVFALHELLQLPRFDGVLNPDPENDLPDVASAYERTQEMQAMFFAIMGWLPEEIR